MFPASVVNVGHEAVSPEVLREVILTRLIVRKERWIPSPPIFFLSAAEMPTA